MKRRYEVGIVALFLVLSSAVLFFWRSNDLHATTGDEPHYLVIADGLLPTFELEQTGPYTREFQNRTIVENGLAPTGAVPDASNTHAVTGPRGLFNVHNIGLPIILSVPYLFGGETAARLTMIGIGAAIIWLLLQIVSLTALSTRARALLVAPWAVALPLVPASTQIYPDLPAGAISLLAIFFLWRNNNTVKNWQRWSVVAVLSYLPWLHLRYALPMVILLTALTWHWRQDARSRVDLFLRMWAVPTASVFALACYNMYAFGNPSGPYESEAIMLNGTAIMQFFGLFLDQNQGFFMQQPLHFVGLFFLVALFQKNRVAIAATILIVLGTLGPNATHWNLYGGWSFSGRFGWTAVAVFSSITIMALAHLWTAHQRTAKILLGAGIVFQLRLLWEIFIEKADLFPRVFNGWIGTYSAFSSSLETSLPQWRDIRWAFSFVPNFVWVMFACGVLVIGAMKSLTVRQTKYAIGSLVLISTSSLVMHAQFGDFPYPEQRWSAVGLPSNIGSIEDGFRVANKEGTPGLLTYGPYWVTPEGTYEVGVRYKSTADVDSNALLDINSPERSKLVQKIPLLNTQGEFEEFFTQITIDSTTHGKIEVRTFYEGQGSLTVDWIQLRRVSDNVRE
jgi:hypothetical protein